jgi:hypothetical protein
VRQDRNARARQVATVIEDDLPAVWGASPARRVGGALLAALAVCSVVAGCNASAGPARLVPGLDLVNDDAGLVAGAAMDPYLMHAAEVPAGYLPDPELTSDSGEGFRSAQSVSNDDFATPDAIAEQAGKNECPILNTTAFVTGVAGPSSASFAQNAFQDSNEDLIYSEVDSYRGNDAATVVKDVRALVARCTKFVDVTHDHPTYHLTTSVGPAVGDEALTIVSTSPTEVGGQTSVLVRVKNLLVIVQDNRLHPKDTGEQAVDYAKTVTARVLAATGH